MRSEGKTEKKEIPDDVWKLVKFRMMQTMPATSKLAIGGRGSFSKEEVIEHLNNKDKTGELIVRMQLSMIRYIVKSHND